MNKPWFALKSAVLFLLIFFSFNLLAAQFPPPPQPFRYISDYTRTLGAEDRQYLEQKLQQYGKQTSSQIAVVIVPTVGEYAVSEYAFELGDKWGIGRKQLNNGVLMLIAKNDRKIFIAVGQGLEGVLTDALVGQIIRQQITPAFKQNHYAQGIDQGLEALIAASKGEYAPMQEEENEFEKFIPFLMVAVFILFVLFGEWRGRGQVYVSPSQAERIIRQSVFSRGRNNGGGFGGFGGGSSGGFGGGGFGGGGAGGSW